MDNYIILEEDGVFCRASRPLIPRILNILGYDKKIGRKTQWGTQIETKRVYLIDMRSGRFLSGLFNRVRDYLDATNVEYSVVDRTITEDRRGVSPLRLRGITLREDQASLIASATKMHRGVVVSPTGSGKTIMALGFLSQYPNARSLILVHRLDILKQFIERAGQYLPGVSVQTISGGKRQPITGQLVCSTIQSISKYPVESVSDIFDIVICDECHHVCDRQSLYGKFVMRNLAPIKIGFTATLPTDPGKLLSMEGLLGPVIGKLLLEDSHSLGVVLKPTIYLVPIPTDPKIAAYRSYRDLYEHGIVTNYARNSMIARIARDTAKDGKTSLIIVKAVKHGHTIKKRLGRMGISAHFVWGGTSGETRTSVKAALSKKEVKVVICTDVWKEGTDIPALDCVILACGGKSELQTIQAVGRGLRITEGKDGASIYDFLDPYRYLAEHAIARIAVYTKNDWI